LEQAHIDRIPDGEREEIRQIFRGKGFEGEMLEKVVMVITEDRQRWVNTMLTEEWGLRLRPPLPWRAALATLSAFVLAGLIPLVPTVLAIDDRANESFVWSSVVTGVTFFGIGVFQGREAGRRALASGVETLALGGAAASVAFVVGKLLERFAVATQSADQVD
jgi:VIT1/CCC1 family predicted Fe2+/Mn2+ transporter